MSAVVPAEQMDVLRTLAEDIAGKVAAGGSETRTWKSGKTVDVPVGAVLTDAQKVEWSQKLGQFPILVHLASGLQNLMELPPEVAKQKAALQAEKEALAAKEKKFREENKAILSELELNDAAKAVAGYFMQGILGKRIVPSAVEDCKKILNYGKEGSDNGQNEEEESTEGSEE